MEFVVFEIGSKDRIIGQSLKAGRPFLFPDRRTPNPPLRQPLICRVFEPEGRTYGFAEVLPLRGGRVTHEWHSLRITECGKYHQTRTAMEGQIVLAGFVEHQYDLQLPRNLGSQVPLRITWYGECGLAEIVATPFIEIDAQTDKARRLNSEASMGWGSRIKDAFKSRVLPLIESGEITWKTVERHMALDPDAYKWDDTRTVPYNLRLFDQNSDLAYQIFEEVKAEFAEPPADLVEMAAEARREMAVAVEMLDAFMAEHPEFPRPELDTEMRAINQGGMFVYEPHQVLKFVT